MITIALALALAGLASAAVVVLSLVGTRRLLTLPRPAHRATPAGLGLPFEDISFVTSDGVTLRGWFFPLPGAPLIVYCPGRGWGLNDFDFRYAPILHEGGYQALMFDWRGMGASDGRTSMAYWEQLDLRAAVAYGRERAAPTRIGALGASLGAAVIFLAAGDLPDIAAAAGECAFSTYEGMISGGMSALYGLPGFVTRLLAWMIARLAAWRRRFPLHAADPVRAIARISPRPVFVIHGSRDRHVPVAAARALYDAAGQPKDLWLPPTSHTAALEQLGEEYSQRILRFFDAWLKTP